MSPLHFVLPAAPHAAGRTSSFVVRRSRALGGFATIVALAAGPLACSDSSAPTAVPVPTDSLANLANQTDAPDLERVAAQFHLPLPIALFAMLDDCDPTTFNAVLGAGTCVGRGRTTFDAFIAELTATKDARRWRFIPRMKEVRAGTTLIAINLGGEAHTFTPVAEFGGGIVPELNELTGNPIVAPECTTLEPGDFIGPFGIARVPTDRSAGDTSNDNGSDKARDATLKIMCCLHPWMRATVEVKDHGGKGHG